MLRVRIDDHDVVRRQAVIGGVMPDKRVLGLQETAGKDKSGQVNNDLVQSNFPDFDNILWYIFIIQSFNDTVINIRNSDKLYAMLIIICEWCIFRDFRDLTPFYTLPPIEVVSKVFNHKGTRRNLQSPQRNVVGIQLLCVP